MPRGEAVRDLLEACGASRYLEPIGVDSTFSYEEQREMRRAAGCESSSRTETIEDRTLRGLSELLTRLSRFDHDDRLKKARLLWEALGDVEDRRGANIFSGTYRWFYHYQRSARFDAMFVRQLNTTAWVPETG